ncbi:MAG: 4Fe-4S binding protein [Clostridia bacterium]|nr:4Fe-4S binding protein [Clostridia bacterium]
MNRTETKKQASNLDEQGNVLYLDQERLDRKEVGFPPYKNKSNGLGIYNWLLENVLYMSKKRWPIALKLYQMFVRFSVWMKEGGWKARLYKTGIKLYPDRERPTGTVVLPLHVDVADKGEKVVIPLDLIKQSLKTVPYIAGMDGCLCREANDCGAFPHDLGCLFLGEAAKAVVKHELGRQFTYEEACARVDEAARVGLMGQAVWIEVEQMLWGVRNDLMDDFVEICFCCPCCCIAMRLARNATAAERHRFHPAGWTAVPDRTKCTGCRACVTGPNGCPVEAITFGEDGRVQIDQEACVGCGICRARCGFDVIKIKQTMPMRRHLHEYFLKDYSLDRKAWGVSKEDYDPAGKSE